MNKTLCLTKQIANNYANLIEQMLYKTFELSLKSVIYIDKNVDQIKTILLFSNKIRDL